MEIIKKGKPYQVVCPICNSLLEPAERDIIGGFGGWPFTVKCPVCDENIELKGNKFQHIRKHTQKMKYEYDEE